MKLIHCSDLHLDSKLGAHLDPQQVEKRTTELRLSFERMVAFARKEGIAAVLIAGDLFDTQRVTVTTASLILNAIAKASEIEFFYLRGNHDESTQAFGGQELPANLKLFDESWTTHPLAGNVAITGAELTASDDETFYQELSLDPSLLNIVMLHGQVGTSCGPDAVYLPGLKNKNIDYLALGHLHSYQQDKLDERGVYCYSGCLEGRGFDECGEKGFVILDTEGPHGIEAAFKPFATRSLHHVYVDISSCTTAPEMRDVATQAAHGIPARDLVKFVLTGTFTPDTYKDQAFLKQSLESSFYAVEIDDKSTMALEEHDYAQDISLKGSFTRLVMNSGLSETEQARVITCGLAALRGDDAAL